MKLIVRGTVAAMALLAVIGAGERAMAQDSLKVERPSSDLITKEQIAESKVQNAWDAVEQLHSNWLIERLPKPTDRNATGPANQPASTYTTEMNGAGKTAPGGAGGIQIYFDGTRIGGTTELKTMRASEIYSIRRMNGTEASGRFGLGHASGVIYVTSLAFQAKVKQ